MKLHPADIHNWLEAIRSYFIGDTKQIEKQIKELRNESMQVQLFIRFEERPEYSHPEYSRLYNIYDSYRIHGVVANQQGTPVLHVDAIFPTFPYNSNSAKILKSHATILRDAILMSLSTDQTKTLRLHFLPMEEDKIG